MPDQKQIRSFRIVSLLCKWFPNQKTNPAHGKKYAKGHESKLHMEDGATMVGDAMA